MMAKNKDSKESKAARRKRDSENNVKKESSRFGFFIVLICAIVVSLSMIAVSRVEKKDPLKPDPIDVTTVNSRALSTSWSCPFMGNSGHSALTIVNPLEDRDALVRISSYTSSGEKINVETNEMKPSTKTDVDLTSFKGSGDYVIYVESFSAPIAVFRTVELSDGYEFPPCLPFTSSKDVFPSLTTERLSGSVLYLANPFNEAVVVDISATLSNGTGENATAQVDQLRGQVIPAKGRTVINLQDPSAFGRFSDISLTINSRSGFFVSEVLMSYDGAQGAEGQTVVLPARQLEQGYKHFVPGVSPTKIVGVNGSEKAGSITVGAIASDARSFLNEPVNFLAGLTLNLGVPGEDFGVRTLSFLLDYGGTSKDMYAAWNHVSSGSVSSGEAALFSSEDKILPIYSGDSLDFYNPSNKEISIKINVFGTDIKKTIKVEANSFKTEVFQDIPADTLSIVRVSSSGKIFSASSGPTMNRHNVGIRINK